MAPEDPYRRLRKFAAEFDAVWDAIEFDAPDVHARYWPEHAEWVTRNVKYIAKEYADLATRDRLHEEYTEKLTARLREVEDELLIARATAAAVDFTTGFDPSGHWVYMLWGADEACPLYVGMSSNVLTRLGSHLADKTKRASVLRVTLIPCTDLTHAVAVEAAHIRSLRPPWNRAGVDRAA